MLSLNESVLFCALAAVQIVGIVSVAAARLTERSYIRAIFQRAFFASLLAVGLATVVAIRLDGPGWWSSAAVLGLMAVGATLDCTSSRTGGSV